MQTDGHYSVFCTNDGIGLNGFCCSVLCAHTSYQALMVWLDRAKALVFIVYSYVF